MLFGVYIFGVAHSCQEKNRCIMARPVNFARRLPIMDSCPTVKLRGFVARPLFKAHFGLTKPMIYAIFPARFLASAWSISDPKK